MKVKTIDDIPVRGRKVLMRVDFNVPLVDHSVRDDSRIKAAMPTIMQLLSSGARLTLVSHLGRPKGEVREELRLDPVAGRLGGLLNRAVAKLDDAVGDSVKGYVEAMQDGDILMLENIRFYKGEEENDSRFARALADPFDLFVNDAFGTAHRAHASTVGVAEYLPAVAGLLMKKEIEVLSRCLEDPKRPLVVILGGAKVSDKMNVIRRFLDLADLLLIGGGMANTFLAASGFGMGASFYESDQIGAAAKLLDESKTKRGSIILPRDLVITEELARGSSWRNALPREIENTWKAVDIGSETAALFSEKICTAATVIWNGPLGVFETPPYDKGTAVVAEAVAGSGAFSIVGGGDLVAALESLHISDKISFISTGGGATLEFWEGRELPGIKALQKF